MGVTTHITLQEIQQLFPARYFSSLQATSDGVMDTTYIVDNYILKKYERDLGGRIESDAELLASLSRAGLCVPRLVDASQGWYLYEKLQGEVPQQIELYHIQSLARFMAKMHRHTHKRSCSQKFLQEYDIKELLDFTKKEFYYYFSKLNTLKKYKPKSDGFIHGDIFKDNTVFDGQKIGVFDFIDGGCGEFSFDIAVALVAFNPKNKKAFTQLFLNTYNQNAPFKISRKILEKKIQIAAKLYALLRIGKYKNPQKAKLLANLW